MRPLSLDDLDVVRGLLPYTAQHLIAALGERAALALLNRLPGVQMTVPKHPDRNPAGARRWAMLEEIVGASTMPILAGTWGGSVLEIPTCHEARREARDRAIRAEFDRLTMREGYSKAQAIYEIGLAHMPITSRQLEKIVDRPDIECRQAEMF